MTRTPVALYIAAEWWLASQLDREPHPCLDRGETDVPVSSSINRDGVDRMQPHVRGHIKRRNLQPCSA